MASNQSTSLLGVFTRITWMMAGPAILLLLAYSLVTNEKGWLAPSSVAFLVVLIAVVLARWLDPLTSEGETATAAHLRRYTLMALGIGIAVWAIVNVLGNHWFVS
jgi:hypothetical protein